MEMDIVTSALAQLCKIKSMFSEKEVLYLCQDFLCALSERLFIPFFRTLPRQTVIYFLSRRHNKLCHFIIDIMAYFLAGKDQPKNNQPNVQAGS